MYVDDVWCNYGRYKLTIDYDGCFADDNDDQSRTDHDQRGMLMKTKVIMMMINVVRVVMMID